MNSEPKQISNPLNKSEPFYNRKPSSISVFFKLLTNKNYNYDNKKTK